MSEPTTDDVDAGLRQIEQASRASNPNRQLARERIARFRQRPAITPDYDFNHAPRELKQVVYDATVRFSRRRWWTRVLR